MHDMKVKFHSLRDPLGARCLGTADDPIVTFVRHAFIALPVGLLALTTGFAFYQSFSAPQPTSYLLTSLLWLVPHCAFLFISSAHALESLIKFEPPKPASVPSGQLPKVSIHVPIHREPVEIVAGTLRRLAALKYPSFEVIVIDNNTDDTDLWHPIMYLCEKLGFQFFHLDHWPGYKAGALNFAIRHTSADAELVAVIDADYHVEPNFLRRIAAHFCEDSIAFVQTPQDYRYQPSSQYESWCYFAYRYFFDLTMVARQKNRSLIFAGTMGVIRKSVLVGCGGWNESCLTEDAELGLRAATRGYFGQFVNISYGKGLMPLDYLSFRRQRFRWAFGGAQMVLGYWRHLLGCPAVADQRALSLRQRISYSVLLAYWFESWAVVGVVFSFWALTLLQLFAPASAPNAVSNETAMLPLAAVAFRCLQFMCSLRSRSKCTWGAAWGAYWVLASLHWVVSSACVQAFRSKLVGFERTPKQRMNPTGFLQKLCCLRTECVFGLFGVALGSALLLQSEVTMLTAMFLLGCFWGSMVFLSSAVVLAVEHTESCCQRQPSDLVDVDRPVYVARLSLRSHGRTGNVG